MLHEIKSSIFDNNAALKKLLFYVKDFENNFSLDHLEMKCHIPRKALSCSYYVDSCGKAISNFFFCSKKEPFLFSENKKRQRKTFLKSSIKLDSKCIKEFSCFDDRRSQIFSSITGEVFIQFQLQSVSAQQLSAFALTVCFPSRWFFLLIVLISFSSFGNRIWAIFGFVYVSMTLQLIQEKRFRLCWIQTLFPMSWNVSELLNQFFHSALTD